MLFHWLSTSAIVGWLVAFHFIHFNFAAFTTLSFCFIVNVYATQQLPVYSFMLLCFNTLPLSCCVFSTLFLLLSFLCHFCIEDGKKSMRIRLWKRWENWNDKVQGLSGINVSTLNDNKSCLLDYHRTTA